MISVHLAAIADLDVMSECIPFNTAHRSSFDNLGAHVERLLVVIGLQLQQTDVAKDWRWNEIEILTATRFESRDLSCSFSYFNFIVSASRLM